MTVAQRIRVLREQCNLTQDELGVRVGRSRRVVSTWERGSPVPADLLPRIARALNVAIATLLVDERNLPRRLPDEVQCDNCGDQVEYRPYQIWVQRFDSAGNEVHSDLLRLCGECGSGLRIVLRLNKATA